jgi:hypothetical protein
MANEKLTKQKPFSTVYIANQVIFPIGTKEHQI